MDLGFIQAGHKIVWANDIYADAVQTYRANIGHHIDDRTIEELSAPVDADLVIGGFPCQGFSVANWNRRADDSRNALYLQFLRVVKEVRPLYFVAENVKGILSIEKGKVFEKIIEDFESLGYHVQYAVLNAANYGVPQKRQRVFILGTDAERARPVDFPPKPTHAEPKVAAKVGLKPWVCVGDALAVLPEPSADSGYPNHSDYSTYKLRFNNHLGHRWVDPRSPAPTVTARGDEKGGVVVLHHPNNQRRISPREAATIQSFPLDFEFFGNRTSAYRQIANAVPPLLALNVARCLPLSRAQAIKRQRK